MLGRKRSIHRGRSKIQNSIRTTLTEEYSALSNNHLRNMATIIKEIESVSGRNKRPSSKDFWIKADKVCQNGNLGQPDQVAKRAKELIAVKRTRSTIALLKLNLIDLLTKK